MPDPIRVGLADDHPVFLSGLSAFLREQPDLDLVGTATDGQQRSTSPAASAPTCSCSTSRCRR